MIGQASKGYNAYYDRDKKENNISRSAQSSQRMKSEAPLGQQLRAASLSNPDHRRRMQALQGLPPEDDDEGDEYSMTPSSSHKRSHRDKGNHLIKAANVGTGQHDRRSRISTVPDTSDLLSDFKVPEGPQVFKSEPVDMDLWDSMFAPKAKSKKKQNKDEQSIDEQPAAIAKQTSLETAEMRGILNTRAAHNGRSAQADSRDIVDLTEEDDQRERSTSRPVTTQAQNHVPTSDLPRPLTATQVQFMDQTSVPQNMLQQAIDIYQRHNTAMPANIYLWSQLKAFVTQHPSPLISPQLCLLAQTHAFHTEPAPAPSRISAAQSTNNIDTERPADRPLAVPAAVSRNHMNEEDLRLEAPHIKVEPEDTVWGHQQEATRTQPLRNHQPNPAHLISSSRTQASPKSARINAHVPQVSTVQNASTNTSPAIIDALTKPIDYLPDILPRDAPPSHPHLTKLWDTALLDLPIDQHDHLNIPDTVIAILAKYDLKSKSVIAAFLDFKKVKHFFFLFTSREGSLHSWSIEREEDIVTVSRGRTSARTPILPPSQLLSCNPLSISWFTNMSPRSE